MKNLTIWNNTDIVKYDPKAGNQELDFDSTMQALQQASGHTEYRVIPMRCDKYDKPYTVVYKRAPGFLSFYVDEVIKQQTAKESSRGIFSGLFSSNRGVSTTYDQNEFCYDGRYCPWCGHDGGTVFCHDCGELYCGGKKITLINGKRIHECVPRCGSRGELSPSDHISGHQLNGHQRQKQNQKSLAISASYRLEHKSKAVEIQRTIRQEITYRITKK